MACESFYFFFEKKNSMTQRFTNLKILLQKGILFFQETQFWLYFWRHFCMQKNIYKKCKAHV